MLDQLLQAFGRSHLITLHLPIALLLVAAIIETYRLLKPRQAPAGVDPDSEQGRDLHRLLRQTPTPSAYTCVFFATLSAAVAATSGWLYAGNEFTTNLGGGGDLEWHRWLGLSAAALSLVTLVLGMVATLARVPLTTRLYKATLLLAAVAVGWAGHLGGELVHGEGYILEPILNPAPESPTPTENADPTETEGVALATDDNPDTPDLTPVIVPTALTFSRDIAPILDRFCVKCHRPGKARGDLILNSLEESLYAITPGDAANSILVQLISLPESDEDSMPKDKPNLSAEQIQTITDWINSLPADGTLPEAETHAEPEALEPAPEVRLTPGPQIETQPTSLAFDAADQPIELTAEQTRARDQAIARLRASLISANTRAEGLGGVEVRIFENRDTFTDSDLDQLEGLEPSLTVLDLTATAVTDAGVERLAASFPRLRILRLGQTDITDAAMSTLAPLQELALLDVHLTGVTAAGLESAATIGSLRVLRCWNTAATADQLAELAPRFSSVEFQHGG